VIDTNNMQPAARISDPPTFFYMGVMIAHAPTPLLFRAPRLERTEASVRGRFV
jgi:ABC-type phosphate transport system ATPase subunit